MTHPKPACEPSDTSIPDTGHAVDLAAELARRAHDILTRPRRGSISPVYDACACHLATILAKEAVFLAHVHGRPVEKVIATANRTVAALEAATADLIEECQKP
jgi:hypothetical protein